MDNNFEPKLVGFLCRWCTYQAADLAGVGRRRYPPNLVPIRVMCSGRVDPLFVVRAYLKGADGVFVGGCHPGDCHYVEGNLKARRRFGIIQTVFSTLGLEPERLRLAWISASEGQKFATQMNDFNRSIEKLGQNPSAGEVFL
ncbi:MAG: methyl-viologen-reducing hydrogenase subunit delta [Latescibacteria bacterium DG_63]|nr:MAG: methyl-viologen-reducing hydrogenase subunit delta [Latescibacteria bacterium DG_63]